MRVWVHICSACVVFAADSISSPTKSMSSSKSSGDPVPVKITNEQLISLSQVNGSGLAMATKEEGKFDVATQRVRNI